MKILVTGAAGFIGFHLSRRLVGMGHEVVGIDNLNDYYDVKLKHGRLDSLKKEEKFSFHNTEMGERKELEEVFSQNHFECVINLAAQPGVRYSLENPHAYVQSNIVGFVNLLECCRRNDVKHLIFASSSSVYGANTKMPFSVHDNVDHPVSLYAASKKSNELLAHSYAHLFNLPCTGLRFFTVYGPWGRPDMAYFLFTKAIIEGKPIKVFNNGEMMRDFTYIDDIVDAMIRLIDHIPQPNDSWDRQNPDPSSSYAPFKVYNIGNNKPEKLGYFIEVIEKALGKKAIKELLPMQNGDVKATYANVDDLIDDAGFKPETPLEVGIGRFVEWYSDYYTSNI